MKSFVSIAFLVGLAGAPVFAGMITTAPAGGTTTTFPGGNSCFLGSSSGTVGGFPITATNNACYNDDNLWRFFGNGNWLMPVVGDNSQTTVLTIDLLANYSSVGGFMNYAPGYGTPTIAVLDSGMNLLESYDLSLVAPISTPHPEDDATHASNDGAFRGISRPTADIRYLQFGGSFLALHDLTVDSTAAVPEPATFGLIGLGAIALAWRRRRG